MPRLSDSMTDGTIARWLKKDGDQVTRGEEIVEIDSDKATLSFEADVTGTLHLHCAAGDVIAVGAPIASIETVTAGATSGRTAPAPQTEPCLLYTSQALTNAIKGFDVVITTALVPGRAAPRLVTAEAVEGMKPGSVIVDLAGESGGNCELTTPGKTTVEHDVTICSPLNLAAEMPEHASQLYARNIQALLELMLDESGGLTLNFDDEIIAGAAITRDGEIVNARAKALVEGGK